MNQNNFCFKKPSQSNLIIKFDHQEKKIMKPPKNRSIKAKISTPSSHTPWGVSFNTLLNTSKSVNTTTTLNLENESKIVLCITEGRGEARCEVGLALIDISHPILILCQISDTSSYTNTLTKINIFNPTDIVFPQTFIESNNRLVDIVKRKFNSIKLIGMPRKTFNKNNGFERIKQICLPEINTILMGLQHRYYALAAASGLLSYLQNNLNIFYAKESIKVEYQESEGFAIIDISTADNLELVLSTKPAQASRYSTIFGILNNCYTRVGARSLRSSILQPPFSLTIIQKRLDCVTELIKHPEKLLSIQAILQKVANIHQLLTISIIYQHPAQTLTFSNRQLNYLLLLNNLVDLVEPLSEILFSCQQTFFTQFGDILKCSDFIKIRDYIRNTIHPAAHPAKGQDGVIQRCFAIKPGVNGLLDLVRKTYSERLNEMNEYVKSLAKKYNLHLTLGNNYTKGYHIVFHLNSYQRKTFKKDDLPAEFIQIQRTTARFTMKTLELINFSTRLDDITMEILKISNVTIYKILTDTKQYIGLFYKICEGIAKLDMLQSLAQASTRHGYVCPQFDNFIQVTNSLHPILDLILKTRPVPNMISICKDYNLQIITGPNGSGKSIYIRQVMLLQIMAQIGCYVPASSAIFRPVDRLFARIYLEDNLNFNASTFVLEIKEIVFMMNIMTENSLFIIDELCRSTNLEEGTALAMAICQKFAKSKTFVLVTTHFALLTKLIDVNPNIKIWQMETVATGTSSRDLNLEYKHNLIPGITQLENYGILLVRDIWPFEIVNSAYEIVEKIKDSINKFSKNMNQMSIIDQIFQIKYKLESDLKTLNSQGKLTRFELNKQLNWYQNTIEKFGIEMEQPFIINGDLFNLDLENNNESIEEISNHSEEEKLSIDDSKSDVQFNNECSTLIEESSQYEELLENLTQNYLESCQDNQPQTELINSSEDFNLNGNCMTVSSQKIDGDFQSAIEDLQSCSQEFFQDEDFNSIVSYNTANDNTFCIENEMDLGRPSHIFPIVKVIQGSSNSNKSISFGSEDDESNNNHSTFGQIEEIKVKKRNVDQNHFIPPRKLTKKEILEEFNKQDETVYASSPSSPRFQKYMEQLITRPSIKQIQNTKHLAYLKRNGDDIQVYSFPNNRKSNQSLKIFQSTQSIDLSIFSDKNAKSFDEFLNSKETNLKSFHFKTTQDNDKNNNNNKECHEEEEEQHQQHEQHKQHKQQQEEDMIGNFNFNPSGMENGNNSNEETLSPYTTPNGFYKQNKNEIEGLLNKYLKDDGNNSKILMNKKNIFEDCEDFDDFDI